MSVIACLGWGSLIWDPDGLPVTKWHDDGPGLPIEFARLSGGDRVTLVVMPDGPRVTVLWTVLEVETLADAVAALRRREKTKSDWIGRWPASSRPYPYNDEIGPWAEAQGVDAVVWTAIPPKWDDENGRIPSEDEVVTHLSRLSGAARDEPYKYIRQAPGQIQTPYRQALSIVVGDT